MEILQAQERFQSLIFEQKNCVEIMTLLESWFSFYRGPHGIKQSELGQDRNVAALRMTFMP